MKRIELDKGMKVTIEAIENDLTIDINNRIDFSLYKTGDFLKVESINGTDKWFCIFDRVDLTYFICCACVDQHFFQPSYSDTRDNELIYKSNIKRITYMDDLEKLKFHKLLRNNGKYFNSSINQIKKLFYTPKCGDWVYLLDSYNTEWLFIYKSTNHGYIQKYVAYGKSTECLYTDCNDLIITSNVTLMRPMSSDEMGEFDRALLSRNYYWNSCAFKLVPRDCKVGDIVKIEESLVNYYVYSVEKNGWIKGMNLNGNYSFFKQTDIREFSDTSKVEFCNKLTELGVWFDNPNNTFTRFKDGDYVYVVSANGAIWKCIYRITMANKLYKYVSYSYDFDAMYVDDICAMIAITDIKSMRLMTTLEIEDFNEKLKLRKLKWNPALNSLETIKWTPEIGEDYYFVSTDGMVHLAVNVEHCVDKQRMEICNCFQTKEKAEECAKECVKFFKSYKNDNI